MKRVLLAALLLACGLTAAYAVFETRRETNYRRLIEQGETALADGDTYSALEDFSGAAALRPQSMLGYLRRGETYRRRGELEAALRDLMRASQLDPTATRPLELLGDVNAALLRYDRAAARYEAYLALDDQSPRVLYKLALARYRDGQPVAGADAARKALALDARFGEAQYLLGLCLRDLRKNSEALAALQRAVELSPTLLPAREELAELYGRLGRNDERLRQLEALVALDPGPSRSVALGLAFARAGNIDRAVPTLRDAAERYPDEPYLHVALGRVWLEAAQARNDRFALAKALEALEGAVGNEDSSEAMTLFGRALLLAGDEPLAERVLQQATEKFPADPLAFFYLAEAAERGEHPDVARRALLDYHTIEGEETDPRRRGAFALRVAELSWRLNDAPTAIEWYSRANTVLSLDAAQLVHAAAMHLAAGDRDAAVATLEKALEKDPANPQARALQRRLESLAR